MFSPYEVVRTVVEPWQILHANIPVRFFVKRNSLKFKTGFDQNKVQITQMTFEIKLQSIKVHFYVLKSMQFSDVHSSFSCSNISQWSWIYITSNYVISKIEHKASWLRMSWYYVQYYTTLTTIAFSKTVLIDTHRLMLI